MLPTPHGLLFAAALFTMLLIAVNYNNGLAYAFVFLVGAMAAVSMLFTHRNLAGLSVSVADAQPVFAGEDARFPVRLHNSQGFLRQNVWLLCGDFHGKADVAALATTEVSLPVTARSRGYCHPPRFHLSSAYPFGLLYTWSRAMPAGTARGLVYPRAEGDLPLPVSSAERLDTGDERREGDDFAGLREYQPGDSPRHVHWKAAAATGALVTKQFGGGASERLWLDWDLTHGGTETRLSQLAAWVCRAESDGLVYGLRLPGREIELGAGPPHRHECLKALAVWGLEDAPVV